ncbi:ABC transporter permease [bacterium]|nr:ABC transporter permease [bacterium]
MKTVPSKLIWLLNACTAKEDQAHLQGDYIEIFQIIQYNQGSIKACRWILRQIIVSASLLFTEYFAWRVNMLKNYIKMTGRSFKRQKSYSIINIFGLAVGMACSILILQWVQDELSYDRFHDNGKNLYVATFSNGSTTTPTALSGYLKTEFPEIINTARYQASNASLKYGDKQHTESGGMFVDPQFINMFTIPFLTGDANTALDDPNSIIISQRIACKYFGTIENAMDKSLFAAGAVDLKVTGIFENYPDNSHISCEYIAPLALFKNWGRNLNTWQWNSIRTYVQVGKNTDIEALNKKIINVVQLHREKEQRPLALQSILRLHLYRFNRPGGLITYIYIFTGMAFFILIIACINFMNLATARAFQRAREVGIRKTIGADRRQLIHQFFSESMVLTTTAAMLSILLIILILPAFNNLTAKSFTINFLLNPKVVLGISGIIILTGVIAGSYPALFLSRFTPIKVMRGTLSSGIKKAYSRKIMVIIQFVLSVFLILCTLVVYRQVEFMRHKDIGFDRENIIYFTMGSHFSKNISTIRGEMLNHPGIIDMTVTNIAPYRWNTNAGENDVYWEGKTHQNVSMVMNTVDAHYLKTFGLAITEGRFFSEDLSTDTGEAFVINETAVREMEMESPIGKSLKIWQLSGHIIGVVKDFHFESMHRDIIPMAMRIDPRGYNHACIRISKDKISSTIHFIEQQWQKIYPEDTFEYHFLDDTIDGQYRAEIRIGQLFKVFTALAIIISCLGLFGLISFTTSQRQKEIAIRKVCGASIIRMYYLLSEELMQLVLIAIVIASPVAFWAMGKWVNGFANQVPISIDLVFIAGGLAIVLTMLTISYHTIKAVRSNPVKAIRNE